MLVYNTFVSRGGAARSAHWAHNPEAVGSNPTPAPNFLSLVQGPPEKVGLVALWNRWLWTSSHSS